CVRRDGYNPFDYW
nr:immunoglobulin heavy chain junction region [Mus musculus]NSM03728.1 immunoglobulin heavy chain junction region [Mus musculus]NSM03747.1 immunoglobulin heavy chain junction region [Mus musculus]NSM03837.1 immunoglobulin heavy chain junction region [Mus musculus]NSM03849.1 immunoglobulin heavy chain junction region [Mus musculus]